MGYQATFKRYEIKYLLNGREKAEVLGAMELYMRPDEYGRTTIRNIYFDTDNFRLVRLSLDRPVYKEKLRIRSYRPAGGEEPVFVELKKKYESVVYKRRLELPENQVVSAFRGGKPLPVHSQIADEIDYFREYYGKLRPKVFLSYEREAYYALDGSDLRVTFDENILFRERDFSMESEVYGEPLLGRGQTLMEIKTSGGIPLWLSSVLSKNSLFKTSFSKYGSAYMHMVTRDMQEEAYNA